jgi:spore coat polysaccharide biosynthesis predicted glycosyltransferase SpsG
VAGGMNALFVSCASAKEGFGHISRQRALAKVFKAHFWQCAFYLNDDESAASAVETLAVTLFQWSEIAESFLSVLSELQPDVVIVDLPLAHYQEMIPVLSEQKTASVVVIDKQDPKFKPDLTFIPAVQNESSPKWFHENTFAGKEWIIIDPELPATKPKQVGDKPRVLFSVGGSCEGLKQYQAVLRHIAKKYHIISIIGPYTDKVAWLKQLSDHGVDDVEVVQNPVQPLARYAQCIAAITLFGVTAYELIALGIPLVLLPARTSDDQYIIEHLNRLGLCARVNESNQDAVCTLMEEMIAQSQTGVHKQPFIDGQGGMRIEKEVRALVERSKL